MILLLHQTSASGHAKDFDGRVRPPFLARGQHQRALYTPAQQIKKKKKTDLVIPTYKSILRLPLNFGWYTFKMSNARFLKLPANFH